MTIRCHNFAFVTSACHSVRTGARYLHFFIRSPNNNLLEGYIMFSERIPGLQPNAELPDADLERVAAGKGPAQTAEGVAAGAARGTANVARGAVGVVGGTTRAVARTALGGPGYYPGPYGW